MKNIFLLLLFSPFYFSSCTKDKGNIKNPLVPVGDTTFYTIVEGYCTDQNTGNPVKDVKITIAWNKKKPMGANPYGGYFPELNTDESGFYSYKFIADTSNRYCVSGIKESECYYFNLLFPPAGSCSIPLGKKVDGSMKAPSNAYISFHIKNIHPFNSNDSICIYGPGWFDGPFWQCRYGSDVDYTIIKSTNGNIINHYQWVVTKNNIVSTFEDSVFIIACDTTNFNIYY